MIGEAYKLILKDIVSELNYTKDVLEKMKEGSICSGIDKILTQYEELFSKNHRRHKNLIADHIEYKASSIAKSTGFRTSEHNKSKHISLSMTSDVIKDIDERYSNRISDLIQFFKHLFSTLNNYQIYRNKDKLDKFLKLIEEIKGEVEYFISFSSKAEKLQEQRYLNIKLTEKNEDQLRKEGILYKKDREKYENLIKENNIEYLFHFTSRSNIESIKSLGGLYPWPFFSVSNTSNISGGHIQSRIKDAQKGFENYIRLSFCENHPMAYSAKKNGRIDDFVVLKINTEILYQLGTWYSNKNAIVYDVEISYDIDMLNSFDFNIFNAHYPKLKSYKEKDQYKAEILVRDFVPLEYIINIDEVLNK